MQYLKQERENLFFLDDKYKQDPPYVQLLVKWKVVPLLDLYARGGGSFHTLYPPNKGTVLHWWQISGFPFYKELSCTFDMQCCYLCGRRS